MKIFLVGFMGCGKTYLGQQLAHKLRLPFFDLDHQIEEKEGKTIAAVFKDTGEEYFRLLEKEVLYLLSESHDSFVMATGGGTPCFYNNIGYMKNGGTVMWLHCSADIIYNRLITEKEKRPLVKDLDGSELYAYIVKKYADRKIYYEQAQITINEDEPKLELLISKIFHT